MSFLHPERLAFAFLALLPLAFHLYQRFARQRRVLPTLRFLARRSTTEERRRRIRRLLLLACRMLALLLAALAWARPVALEDARRLKAEQTQLVIIVDRSLSMQAVVAGQNRFATAVAEARALVERAPTGTPVTLIVFDTGAEILLEAEPDPARVLETLRNLRPTAAGTNLAAGVQAARVVLLAGGGEGRLAILGDLQRDGSDAALNGLLRGTAARLVFSERLLAPTLGNLGVGPVMLEAAGGDIKLTIRASGSDETMQEQTGREDDRRTWKLEASTLGYRREAALENPVFVLPRAALDAETLALHITLSGGDILAADDECRLVAWLPRPVPVCLRTAPAARPYLAAALAALGVTPSEDPWGSVLIGDETARAILDGVEVRGAVIFAGGPTAEATAGTAWSLQDDGPLAVPGLARGRFSRRAALVSDSTSQTLMRFNDGAPAAVERRTPGEAPLLLFGFGAERATSDLVLTAAFPMLVRAALDRVGAGVAGRIVERDPAAPAEESDLRSRSSEEIASLLAPDAAAPPRTGRIGDEPPPDRWTPLLLAAVLILLLAETLLGRRAR